VWECPQIEILAAYMDGVLTPMEKTAVEEHLSWCATCRMTLYPVIRSEWRSEQTTVIRTAMEEITRSLLKFSWALTVFAGQQIANLLTPADCACVKAVTPATPAAGVASESTGWGPVIPDGSN